MGSTHSIKEVGTFGSLWPRSNILAVRALSFPFLSTSLLFLSASRFNQAEDRESSLLPWGILPRVPLQTPLRVYPITGALPLLLS